MAKRAEFQDRNTLTGESNLILPESIYDSHRRSVPQKYRFSLRLDCGISIAHR